MSSKRLFLDSFDRVDLSVQGYFTGKCEIVMYGHLSQQPDPLDRVEVG